MEQISVAIKLKGVKRVVRQIHWNGTFASSLHNSRKVLGSRKDRLPHWRPITNGKKDTSLKLTDEPSINSPSAGCHVAFFESGLG